MMFFKAAVSATFVSLLVVASASPVPANPAPTSLKVTPEIVLGAAPGSASCDGTAPCRTATQAAPFIQASFEKYGFKTPGEQAALLALMAFETNDFKFDVNVFPGRPGQGTRNMMMFPFIAKYALETPDVADQVATIAPQLNANMTPLEFLKVPADTMNAVRALVLRDDLSFASAAWYLRTKCKPEIATGLASATEDAWSKYITTCVGTSNVPGRREGYRKALRAYGLTLR